MAKGLPVMSAETIGMAQKGGAVISDIKITHVPFQGSNKISDGRADLYLGFDILNATDPKNLDKCGPNRTIAVVSTTQTPTGQMVSNRHNFFPNTKSLTAGIDRVTRKEDNVFLDGQAMAEGLFGDAMATNNFMVGVAYQAGTIPLKAESIEQAIKNSGVGVEQSLAAFRWGRMTVVDRAFVEAEIAKQAGAGVIQLKAAPQLSPAARAIVDSVGAQGKVKRLLEIRVPDLIDYQDEAYAEHQPAEAPGIAYDEHGAHLANANGDGRITTEADGGEVRDRLYATGWAKRGPVGLIGSTKSDALLIVTNMLEDLSKAAEGGRVAADRDPESIDRLLASRGVKPIDFAGWKKVDAFERAEGAKEGREHKKVIEPDQMRELAHA